jgi:hypothetical protein
MLTDVVKLNEQMTDAYCIAAAHLQLPHTLIDLLMILSARIGSEGWRYIEPHHPDSNKNVNCKSIMMNNY